MKFMVLWIGLGHFGLIGSTILRCSPTIETEVYPELVDIRFIEFCFDFHKSFRCTVNKKMLVNLNRQVIKCCPGYELYSVGNVTKCVCKKCPYGAKCDPISGSCYCKGRWHGGECIDLCPEGYFGSECEKECEKADNMIACDEVTGKPICHPQLIGKRCDIPCPQGFSCWDGKICRGDNCICPRGWKGSFCDEKCTRNETDCWLNHERKIDRLDRCCIYDTCKCLNNSICSQASGRCECAEGWDGKLCNVSLVNLTRSEIVSENQNDTSFGWFDDFLGNYCFYLAGVLMLIVLCIFFLRMLNRRINQFAYKKMEFPSK